MVSYKITFRVNGNRTEEIITAISSSEAKNIIRAKYAGAKIQFISTTVKKQNERVIQMKKALSIILSAVLLLAVIPIGTVNASAAEDDVIEIRTIAELYSINNNMSGNFKLMNDIDMTQDTAVGGDWDFMGNGWEPIGSNGVYGNTAFTGTFDGNGHIIIGMRIDRNKTPSGEKTINLGLFANNEGTIKNLGINEGIVINRVYTEVIFTDGIYIGGICAYNSGTLSNCFNDADITNSDTKGYSGGICGYNKGDIYNCYNNADVSSRHYTGGICGYSNSGTISDCYNIGNIEVYNYTCDLFSGGICGFSNSGTFTDCYNNGNISSRVNKSNGKSYSGGICGWNGNNVDNCFNTGSVTSSARYENTASSEGVTVSAYAYAYCGGICGTSSKDISTCYNTGEVSSSVYSRAVNTFRTGNRYSTEPKPKTNALSYCFSYTGGICGQQNSGAITNCYNTADTITSVEATAQYYLIEYGLNSVYGYGYYYNSSYSNGSTYKYDYRGGIAGDAGGSINGCYNVGETKYGIEGAGRTVTDCYYLGTAGNSNTGAKALTKAQFQLEMCMPNFDFENTWVIYKETKYKYPQLRENLQEKEKHLISIDVTIPDKTSYLVGEEFDPNGMTVVGHYDDDTSKKITDYEISGFTGEVGRNNITVGEKSAVFYVTVHNKGEWTTVKEPTCTEKGEKKLYCTDCDALLDTEEIPAKGHTEVTDKGHEPTCTESGLTDGSHCSVCNTILTEQEVIPAKGHTPYLNWETIKNPTCIAHGEKVRYCSVCGEVAETMNIDVTDHQPVIDEAKEATCLNSGLTEGSHCSVCHTVFVTQQVIQPKGHDWDEGEIISNPTCTTTGEKLYHCKNCGQTKSETIPIRGHKPSAEWSVIKEATTTETGLEEKHCIVCGAVLESREIPIKTIILGDVNGDGHITVSDATLVQKHVAKLITLTDDALAAADTNKDGYITIADATLIQKYAAKMIDHF